MTKYKEKNMKSKSVKEIKEIIDNINSNEYLNYM